MAVDVERHREQFVRALGDNEGFCQETRWFDGSILLEVGTQRIWLKIYRGKVIDQMDTIPPFGYTFRITGSEAAWDMLISGERMFTDLVAHGTRHLESWADPLSEGGGNRRPDIAIEGNQFEAGRLHTAIYHLTKSFAESFATAAVA
jgi:hypothetical protein